VERIVGARFQYLVFVEGRIVQQVAVGRGVGVHIYVRLKIRGHVRRSRGPGALRRRVSCCNA
jgi:hypothetical protein